MKKLISVLVSIIAVFAVSTAFAVPAMAAINARLAKLLFMRLTILP